MGKTWNGLSAVEIEKTVDSLLRLLEKEKPDDIAMWLGYTKSYVHQISKGKIVPGRPFANKLAAFLAHKKPDRQYPNTVTTRYLPHEEADRQAALALTMAERREAFRQYLERKER